MTYTPCLEAGALMNFGEVEQLYFWATKYRMIIEVGSWTGGSTHALLSGCSGNVIAVDHFLGSPTERGNVHKAATERDIFQDFIRNVGHFKNLSVLRMDSGQAAKLFSPRTADMVFIDGDHEYAQVREDFKNWLPIVKYGGLFCGHDRSMTGVKKALEENGIQYQASVGSLWYMEVEDATITRS